MEFRGPSRLLSVGRGRVLLVRIGVRQCAVKGPSQVKNLAKILIHFRKNPLDKICHAKS